MQYIVLMYIIRVRESGPHPLGNNGKKKDRGDKKKKKRVCFTGSCGGGIGRNLEISKSI